MLALSYKNTYRILNLTRIIALRDNIKIHELQGKNYVCTHAHTNTYITHSHRHTLTHTHYILFEL